MGRRHHIPPAKNRLLYHVIIRVDTSRENFFKFSDGERQTGGNDSLAKGTRHLYLFND
jgi:hypothetical protein